MSPSDFQPREYVACDGALRVYRVGVLWYADVRSDDGRWCSVVEHLATADSAMIACLGALDLLDPEPELVEMRDDIEW